MQPVHYIIEFGNKVNEVIILGCLVDVTTVCQLASSGFLSG
jgi:hypothetical protein